MVQLIILVLISIFNVNSSHCTSPLYVFGSILNASYFFKKIPKELVIHSTVHYAYTRINQFVFANSRYALV